MKIKLIISLIATLFITVGSSYAMDAVNDTKEQINVWQFPGEKIASLDYKNGKLLIYTQIINQEREITNSKISLYDYKQNNIKLSNEWNPKKVNRSFPSTATFMDDGILLHYSKTNSLHTDEGTSIPQPILVPSNFNSGTVTSGAKSAKILHDGYIGFFHPNKRISFQGHKLNNKSIPIGAMNFNETGELLAVAFIDGCVKIYETETIEQTDNTKNEEVKPLRIVNESIVNPIAIKFGPNDELFVGADEMLVLLSQNNQPPLETNLPSEEQHQHQVMEQRKQLKEINNRIEKVEEQVNNAKEQIIENRTQLEAEKKKLDDQRSVFNKLRQWAHGAYQNPLRTLIAAGVVTTTLYFAIQMALARI